MAALRSANDAVLDGMIYSTADVFMNMEYLTSVYAELLSMGITPYRAAPDEVRTAMVALEVRWLRV